MIMWGWRMFRAFAIVSSIAANAGWVVAIISQGLATARLGRTAVGPLWFAIILQLLVNAVASPFLLGFGSIVNLYRHQISIYAGICIVFGVLAVDGNIFSEDRLQHAIAASWLVLVIVDLLWIGFFTLDTRSWVWRYIHDNESQPISIPGNTSYNEEDADEDEEISHTPVMVNQPPRSGAGVKGGSQQTATPETDQDVGMVPSTIPQPPWVKTMKKEQSHSTDMDSTRPTSDGYSDGTGTTGTSSNFTYSQRARVLYDYRGSSEDPNAGHLSLKKGDVLSVSGTSMRNKWWHAQTEDGRTGLAPSNFLQAM
ncbi:hypothetical protein WG66_014517 [Moniliophthora roreri]|nr:hypothetical protein WG66_014517 [Moniliophthora roreri]